MSDAPEGLTDEDVEREEMRAHEAGQRSVLMVIAAMAGTAIDTNASLGLECNRIAEEVGVLRARAEKAEAACVVLYRALDMIHCNYSAQDGDDVEQARRVLHALHEHVRPEGEAQAAVDAVLAAYEKAKGNP